MARVAGALLMLLLGATGARAQDAATAETLIDLSYDTTDVRVRPSPESGTVHHTLHIVLSGNHVAETSNSRSGTGMTVGGAHDGRFGEDVDRVNSSAAWHVLGPQSLARIRAYPQNIETITVTVLPDKQCTLGVTNRLKPGYTEYTLNSIDAGGLGYYSQWEASNESCTIR